MSEAEVLAYPEDSNAAEFEDRLLLSERKSSEINQAVLEPMFRSSWKFWLLVAFLGALVLWGLYAWGYLIYWGMGTAGINRPVYWGFFIATFVFWVGISHAGTMISAVLRLLKADWRRPITRGAEAMTAFALMMAGLFPFIHLGRVWKFYWMVPYPNNRLMWPNFQSPLMWDMVAIFTYLIGSTLYLYLALIPDLAMARDHTSKWRQKLYRILSLGWRGTEAEWHKLQRALSIFSVAIIPIFLSVHSIVSWDFAVTIQPRWHSSIFAPYFVIGAIYSGLAALASILVIVRRGMNLQEFLRSEHFNALGKLVMVAGMAWTYFWFAGFIVEWYGNEPVIRELIREEVSGELAPLFYLQMTANLIPIVLLVFKKVRTTPWMLLLTTLLVNVGMFTERVLIVVGSLQRNFMPFNWGDYSPTWVEVSIVVMTFAGFALLYTLFSRIFPYVPVWEIKEGRLRYTVRRIGRLLVPTAAEIE
ncbi:MAG: polysulfide reductase NrfD [Chloroflexota bacterium]|nr:MAG: polysulfide reductase NrfD [Chloroflexota bacterium]UCF29129.1 MAG: polysulfide reductase NrfD [Chloroflexota bacterium]